MKLLNGTIGRVAIVIPVFNAEAYIADCLDSIIAQTYSNWTVYCVNDGSNDNTASIIDKYAKKDNRIKVFHKSRGGASSARNYALGKIENEEWISFVDADDYIGPNMFLHIFHVVNDKDIDYVRLFHQRTSIRYHSDNFKVSEREPNIVRKVVSREDYFVRECVGGCVSSLLVKSRIVKQQKLSFCENMKMLEDQAFSILCATYANKIMIIEHPRDYFYYSGNETSISQNIKDISNDIIRCVNIVYKAFLILGSETIINDFFYRKYLPIKLEMLYNNRLHYKRTKPTESFLPEIKIDMKNLSLKAKVECVAVKLFKLL